MNSSGTVLYRLRPFLLQGQKRVLHSILVVPQRRVNCADREDFKLNDFTHADSLNRVRDTPQRNRPSTPFLLWKDSWYWMQPGSWFRMQFLVVLDAEVQNCSINSI